MPVEWLLLVASLGAGPDSTTTQTVAEIPNVELLEFLGSWETAEGRWIDPTKLEDVRNEPSARDAGSEATEHKHEQH